MRDRAVMPPGAAARPPHQISVSEYAWVGGPLLVFEELLAHEELGDAGRGEEQGQWQSGCGCGRTSYARSSRRRGQGTRGLLAELDDVVVLDAGDGLPGVRKSGGPERLGDAGHPDGRAGALRGLADCSADGFAQPVVLDGIEAEAAD